ncbi:MAG: flagellar M-ring protein FliF, partial [Rhodobacteraceae bacterium]|nr:flagellar M-ring protein FliF [Paracoccaceae bacterium]
MPGKGCRWMVQNLLAIWNGLDAKRRGIVAGATVAVFVAVLLLSRMATTPGMALLYSGLEGAAAGEVIAALEQRAVPHEVRGSSIWVDDSQRDSLRMVLAAEGLPANSGTGYELLDGLSGFGTTSQMFDAAYWRAKEGELARTVLANPQIRAARVHIGQGSNQPFQTGAAPT